MQDEYFVETDTYKGNRIEFLAFLQKAKPNSISTRAHIQDTVEFIYIVEGSYTAYINQSKSELYKGDLLVILPRETHSLVAGKAEDNKYFVIKADPMLLYSPLEPYPYRNIMPFKLRNDLRKCVFRKDELEGSDILATINEIIHTNSTTEYASEIFTKIGCMKLMACVLCEWNKIEHFDKNKNSADTSALIYKAIEYIHKNYALDITALDCAREVGLSYSYFSRQFSKTVGKSFREYLNKVRCNHAQTALATTEKSVSEISGECGYNDLCYFISVFKQSRGMTPNKFRKSYLK